MKKEIVIILSILTIILIAMTLSMINAWNNSKNTSKEVKKTTELKWPFKEAYFAWGCFWCMEWIFEAQDWVKEAIVWYAGWDEKTANYSDVSSWKTKHREAVKVIYDPNVIKYETLVSLFWSQIDPTNPNGQFADLWPQYKTAIYYGNDEEKNIALKSKKDLWDSKKFDKPIATEILPFTTFFNAEEYHQDYYKKQSTRYNQYKKWSWREDFIKNNWWEYTTNYKDYDENLVKTSTWRILLFFHADWCPTCQSLDKQIKSMTLPNDLLILKVDFDTSKDLTKKYNILTQSSFVQVDNKWNAYKRIVWISDFKNILDKLATKNDILKQTLTPLQYEVTMNAGTEKPFENEYWNNHEDGIYVDVIDWTPLFSSTDKFDSWTWWPSFSRPIDDNLVWENKDDKLWMTRTEVTSSTSNAHLWHVFNDWPKDLWWMRYCINSAALKFIPLKDMEKKWYSKYLFLFDKK
jgi:peptide methionine sulfoxide reductase msrA/msrB